MTHGRIAGSALVVCLLGLAASVSADCAYQAAEAFAMCQPVGVSKPSARARVRIRLPRHPASPGMSCVFPKASSR